MRTMKVVTLMVLVLFIAGCATFGGGKTYKDMTPKEKSTYFMGIYNKQYADTLAMANTPNLTEDQKKVVRTKKEILTKAWPMIQTYDAIAAGGGTPSADAEAAINNLINQLVTAGVK